MSFAIERPAWLLLLVAAIPVAWTALRWFASMSLARRISALALRVLLIATVAGVLAGVSIVRRTERLAVIGVIDVSGSVRRFAGAETGSGRSPVEAARDFLERASEGRGPDDLLGVVVFAGRSMAVALPSQADVLDRPLEIDLPEGSDLAGAIRFAGALVPPDAAGRIVLFSDANATTGDPLAAADEVAGLSGVGTTSRQGTPIDVVPFSYDVQREVIVEYVDTPPRAPEGSTITVRVGLLATSAASGQLLLLRDGVPMDINGDEPGAGRRLSLGAGRHVELVQVELGPERLHPFEAVFEPDPGAALNTLAGDTLLENNRAQAFTITPGKGRVLVLDGVSNADPRGPGATLPRTLIRAGIDVEVVAPAGAPDDLLGYQDYDLVILQNVPAESLNETAQRSLAAFVRDLGGGLVMVGGPDSFGAGGWKGTPIEPLLPVRLDLPESLVTPEAAIIFVIDSSGSMNGSVLGSARSQQEIANESTALAIRTLDEKDLVGVIAFDNSYRVVLPIGANTDPDAAGAKVRSIAPGGGTRLGPALAEARQQLNGVEAKIKHVIVLSDGRSQDADVLPHLAQQMADDGINVSTITIGDEADDDTMDQIAFNGGGQFYRVVNPNVLPRIFLKAVRIVRKPMIREVPFDPVILRTGSELVEGLDQPPPLRGLVLTQPRPEPTITYSMRHPAGEPLLADWQVELGRVAAFTSDAHDWARDWLSWPGYQRMWTQIARVIARPASRTPHELSIQTRGDELAMRFEAVDEEGGPIDLLSVRSTVYAPSGRQIEVALRQTGPGLYEATIPAEESGSYVAIVTARQGSKDLAPVVGGASIASGREYRSLASNDALLAEIAQRTGGRVLDITAPKAELFDRENVPPTRARSPIWRSLLIWAVVILMLDIGTRRIAWDRLISRQFGADLRRAAAEATENRGQRAGAMLTSLRGKARRPVKSGARALDEQDAASVAATQTAIRRKARQERLAEMQAQAERPERSAPIVRESPRKPAEDGPSGLMAAKRRARERFGRQGEDET